MKINLTEDDLIHILVSIDGYIVELEKRVIVPLEDNLNPFQRAGEHIHREYLKTVKDRYKQLFDYLLEQEKNIDD